MTIREAAKEDFDSIWPIFREIVKAGETYAYAADTTKEQAFRIWIEAPRKTYVFEEDGSRYPEQSAAFYVGLDRFGCGFDNFGSAWHRTIGWN